MDCTCAATACGVRQPAVEGGTQQPSLLAASWLAWLPAACSYPGVATPPGLTTPTLTPVPFTSCRTAPATASTMCFVPEWTARPGLGLTPALLEMKTTLPLALATIPGRKARVQWSAPHTFTPTIFSHSAVSPSTNLAPGDCSPSYLCMGAT